MANGRDILQSAPILDSKGGKRNASDIFDGKSAAGAPDGTYVGLYFSAHWCPPCRGFTPQLRDTYNLLKAEGKKFEIVFVSWDEDQSEWAAYSGSMPWLKLPFQDPRIKQLTDLYSVQSIPTLIMLNGDGSLFSKGARMIIPQDRQGKLFPWAGSKGAANGGAAGGVNPRVLLFGAFLAFTAFWAYDKFGKNSKI